LASGSPSQLGNATTEAENRGVSKIGHNNLENVAEGEDEDEELDVLMDKYDDTHKNAFSDQQRLMICQMNLAMIRKVNFMSLRLGNLTN